MDDEDDHREDAEEHQRQPQVADAALLGNEVAAGGERGGDTGEDTGKEDHGDAVADTELVDLLAEPHDKGRTGNEGHDDDQSRPNAGLLEDAVVLADHVVAEGLEKSDGDRRVARDGGDLLLARLAAVTGKTLEGGDGDGQQLDDDRAVDVGLHTEGEDRSLREGAAGHHIVEAQEAAAGGINVGTEQFRVDIRGGDRVTDAEDEQDQQSEYDLLTQFGDAPSFTDRLDHLDHLCLSACCLDSLLGRSGESRSLHVDLLRDLAVAKDLVAVLALVQDTLGKQRLGVDGLTVLEHVERAEVDDLIRLCKNVVEAALRGTARQRHLAAFKTDADTAAAAGLLTLVTAAAGLAVAGTGTATLAVSLFGGAGGRRQFM